MGRVYLCLGKSAEVPYYFERARAHVWNVEELCYFVRENAWLLEPALLEPALMDWVEKQCGLPELAGQLTAALREELPVQAFVSTLFSYTGYCSKEDVEQVEKILRINENAGALERAKARGDYFLESKKYMLAMREYEELLQGLTGMEPSFLGKVYHNCGVACAQLFWFDRAAQLFEKAWQLLRTSESAQQFLTAKRFELGEQGYVDFLADYPDFYQDSLALEEKIQEVEDNWIRSEEAGFVLAAADAGANGEAHRSRQMIADYVKPLQDTYRSCVVS